MKIHHSILIDFMEDKDIKIIAEIGTWESNMMKRILDTYGCSITRYWATDIWGWSERYIRVSKEHWDKLYFKACQLMHRYPQLRVVKGSSLKIFKIFPKYYFDLVYIDADYHYDFIVNTIKNWLPLIKPDGFLLGKIPRSFHPEETLKAISDCFGENVTLNRNGYTWIHRVR